MLTCTGTHSAPHWRQCARRTPATGREVTQTSQKNFWHLLQKNRPGVFRWNLQFCEPAPVAGTPSNRATGGARVGGGTHPALLTAGHPRVSKRKSHSTPPQYI